MSFLIILREKGDIKTDKWNIKRQKEKIRA